MRKLALAIAVSVAMAAALLVTPTGAFARTSNHGPTIPGPHSGVRSPQLSAPAGHVRAAPPRTVSLTCDAGFHTVSSPNTINNDYLVSTSAVSASDVWAVGNTSNIGVAYDTTLAEHWDGTSWTVIPTINPGSFHNDLTGVVAIGTNDVWAVGFYTNDAQGTTATGFAQHWDGSSWNWYAFNSSTVMVLFAVTATSTNDVWAVGTYLNAGTFLPMVDHWNGSMWTAVTASGPSSFDNEFFAVSALSPTDIWAAGETTVAFGSPPQSLAEHWDGANWNLVPTTNGSGDNEILGLAALEAGHAAAVGFGNFATGQPRQSEAWDLNAPGVSTLSNLGTTLGTGDNALLSVGRSGGAVWAVGYSRNMPAAPRQPLNIPATWNATGHTLAWGAPGAADIPGAVNTVFETVTAVSPYAFWATGYQNNSTMTFDQTLTESYCADHFTATAPAMTPPGSAFSLTISVKDGAGTTIIGYRGTVHFSSSDSSAVLPANYTFTAPDAGIHTFTGVVLNKSCIQTITTTDMVMPLTSPGVATITVLGVCQAPTGTPGSRGAGGGPVGAPAARSGASQSGSGVPGPRVPLPRLNRLPQEAATTTTAASATAVAISGSAAKSSAPRAGPAATTTTTAGIASAQAQSHQNVSLVARTERLTEPAGASLWYLLLLAFLLVGLVSLGELRRRRFKEKSNARIRP